VAAAGLSDRVTVLCEDYRALTGSFDKLVSIGALCHSLGRVTDLQLSHLEEIGPHYAETLAQWRQRFRANVDQVRRLGFSEEFIRTWEFYFCYCEGGFRERAIGDVQMLLIKPAGRGANI